MNKVIEERILINYLSINNLLHITIVFLLIKAHIYMKLFELFSTSNRTPILEEDTNNFFELLIEDLKNLSFIEPDLLKVLKTSLSYERGRYYGGSVNYSRTKKNVFPSFLGQHAKIDEVPNVKSAAELHRLIKDDDTVKGVVILFDDRQVFCLLKLPAHPGHDNKELYMWVCSWQNFFKDDHELMNREPGIVASFNTKDLGDLTTYEGQEGKLYKVLIALMKAQKELYGKDGSIKVKVIRPDEERTALNAQRTKAREIDTKFAHLINPPKENLATDKGKRDWANSLKNKLNVRLNTYKEHKAPEANTPEEFLNLIKTEGFMDKIKINGLPYILKYNRLDFDYLRAKQVAEHNRSHIEYSLDSTSDEYHNYWKALGEYRKSIRAEYPDDEEALEVAMEKFRVPSSIKVYMKLDKSSIVVDTIDITSFNKWNK